MRSGAKVAVVLALVAAVGATLVLRGRERAAYSPAPLEPAAVASAPAPVAAPAMEPPEGAPLAVPRLLELGSLRCQACLEMAKVLDALRASQGPRLRVDFIDVFEQPEAGDAYRVELIPTQILYDAAGKEIFRHVGYFSHDDILAKFQALGVRL